MKMKIAQWITPANSAYTTRDIMRWLWKVWRGNRLQTILNASMGMATVVVSLAQVWAVKRAIDVASGSVEGSIYWAVALMGGLVLIDFAINISSVWIRNVLGVKAQNRMQQYMLDRILRSEWNGRERRHSGDVINRLESDVSNVVTFITETLPNTLSVVLLFFGAFAYLFTLDRLLAVITVALLPLFVVLSKVYVRRMRHLTRQVRNSDSQVQSVLQETIQHRVLIKTLESDDAMVGKLESTQSQLRRNVIQRTRFSLLSNFILNFGFSLTYLIAFLWAAVRMSMHTLSFGGMTAYLQLVNRIQSPARNLSRIVPAFVSVFTAAERLMELEEPPLEEQGDPIVVEAPCGVKLDDVSYGYNDGDGRVIDHLSFDFRPGTCTAILGETGAGKTTLIRLILALLRPQEGEISLYHADGDCQQLSPRMRCNFVYVPQGNTLMSGTIRDNLLMGSPTATDDEMYDALHQACADFVSQLPDGLDTRCSESGAGLSEGQAQRIAIARALLRNRPVMLFDEATSALDIETERRLLANVLGSRQHTIIFITHRPAVVEYCDEVLRL